MSYKTIDGTQYLSIKKNKYIKYSAPIRFVSKVTISCNIEIGSYSYVRSGVIQSCSSIGNYCSIGPNVRIGEINHPLDWLSTAGLLYNKSRFSFYKPFSEKHFIHPSCKVKRKEQNNEKKPVVIGNDVWIGSDCKIMRGVIIGDGAVIAAGSVVTKSIPPYAIVGGIPAKIIKYRFDDEIIKKLLELKWWDYDIIGIKNIDFSNINESIQAIKILIENNQLEKFEKKLLFPKKGK